MPPAPQVLLTSLIIGTGLGLLTCNGAHAGWREDCGWDLLAEYCVTAGQPMPAGEGVVVAQTEALLYGRYYLPHRPGAGRGAEFDGKVFRDESGVATVSSHATRVGKYFYGNQSSVASGLAEVHCWASFDLYRKVLGVPGREVSPVSVDIMSAAFVNVGAYDLELRALDHAVNESGFLPIAPTTNGVGYPVPEALVSSYNGLSIGVTSGKHAAGGSPASVDGPGRVKPELVLPFSTTSWATGGASSFAAVLCGVAPPEARQPEVMKAILLAGATKQECAGWDKTATRPLDDRFGAGEANLFYSYRILEGGNAPPGLAGPHGWNCLSHDGSSTYRWVFVVPQGMSGAELSFMATWNRTLDYNQEKGIYEPDPLPDVNLGFAGAFSPIFQESRSEIDNVEHLYLSALTPGIYTVSLRSDRPAKVGVAWRLNIHHEPRLIPKPRPGVTLGLSGLYTGGEYLVERTTDGESWERADMVISPGNKMEWTDPAPPKARMVFYRLRYYTP